MVMSQACTRWSVTAGTVERVFFCDGAVTDLRFQPSVFKKKKNMAFFGTRRRAPLQFFFWQETCAKTQSEETRTSQKTTLKLCGKGSESRPSTRPSRCRKYINEGSAGVQLPERSENLGHPRWQSGHVDRRGKLCAPRAKKRASLKRKVGNCDSN